MNIFTPDLLAVFLLTPAVMLLVTIACVIMDLSSHTRAKAS